jgi:alkylglycerol monooxygenase
MDPLLYALPVFLACLGIEAALLRWQRSESAYRFNDFLSGIGCGMLDQVVNLIPLLGFLLVYDQVADRYGVVRFEASSPWAWVGIVIAHDLAYYWFHRFSHRINVLWAAHVVHHQGEDYNFTVSLRQGTVATWVTFAFYLPLAVMGFGVEMFLVVHGVYQIYQFFVHTQLCPRLGPLEWMLATPRHHRVHHGRNVEYLDRNYGGFFIVWDRLFGTYAPETVAPEVGSLSGIRSWSPLWANFGQFAALARQARQVDGARDKLAVWLGPPEGKAPKTALAGKLVPRYDSVPAPRIRAYAAVQLLLALAAMFYLLFTRDELTHLAIGTLSAFVVLTLVTTSAFFDRRPWARYAEAARLLVLVPLSAVVSRDAVVLAAAGTVALASAAWLWFAGRER